MARNRSWLDEEVPLDPPFHYGKHFAKCIKISLLTLPILLVVVGAAMFLKMQETVTAKGSVYPEMDQEVRSPFPARIKTRVVPPGAEVRAGALLFVLESQALSRAASLAHERVDELSRAAALKQSELSLLKKNPLPREYQEIEITLRAHKEALTAAKNRLVDLAPLYKDKIISKKEWEQARGEVTHLTAQRDAAQEKVHRLQSGLADAVLGKAQKALALSRQQLSGAQVELARINAEMMKLQVRAPMAGRVIWLKKEEGDAIAAGGLLATLAVPEHKKVKAYISEMEVRKINQGQKVRVYATAYDHFKFSHFPGTVTRVYDLPTEKGYPVDIHIDEEPWPLHFGSSAEVKIDVGEKRILSILLGG